MEYVDISAKSSKKTFVQSEIELNEYVLEGPIITEKVSDTRKNMEITKNNLKFINGYEYIYLNRREETKHFFILGAPGSGKTQFLIPFLSQVRERGDKIFLYDVKGDFTEILPPLKNNKLILVAPWDKRGFAWRIGEDIYNRQLAIEFANNVIEETEEIIYSTSARMILAGVIIYLQDKKKTNWTLEDAISLATLEQTKLSQLLMKYAPEAAGIIRTESKLSQNILTNLYSSLSMLIDLSNAWKNVKKTFSIRELIETDKSFTCIMQGSGIYKTMAQAVISSMLSSSASYIEMLPDSNDRRIWFFLDEFPQLGKLEGFVPLLEIGRSKGACVVLAAQNLSQIKNIYGEFLANSIQSMCGIHIYGRISVGNDSNTISESLGLNKVLLQIPTINKVGIHLGYSMTVEENKVVPPYFLSNTLGAKKEGIYMLIVGLEDNYLKVLHNYQNTTKYREKNIFTDWAKPLT